MVRASSKRTTTTVQTLARPRPRFEAKSNAWRLTLQAIMPFPLDIKARLGRLGAYSRCDGGFGSPWLPGPPPHTFCPLKSAAGAVFSLGITIWRSSNVTTARDTPTRIDEHQEFPAVSSPVWSSVSFPTAGKVRRDRRGECSESYPARTEDVSVVRPADGWKRPGRERYPGALYLSWAVY